MSTVLISAVFYFGTIGVLARDVDRKISTISERLVAMAEHGGVPTVTMRIQQDLGDDQDSDSEIYLLSDSGGRLIAGNISVWVDLAAPLDQVIDHAVVRNGRTTIARVLLHRLSDRSLLVVGRDMSDLNQIGKLIGRAIWIGGLLALMLSVGGTLFFHRQIENRIWAIRQAAREIEIGNLSRRIPLSDQPDEFDRLSADINHMLDRIEKLMDGVRHVSNIVAHNLRTPLGRIRGRLEAALYGKFEFHALEIAGSFAIEEIDDLIVVLDKLLQIAEGESGTRRQPFELVKLGDVITAVIELYDAAANAQGIALLASLDGDPVILGDKDLLANILANLLDNALKYAGNSGSIEVRASQDLDTATLIVQDQGPGIPLEERQKVLGRFYRLDSRQQGSGLGLSIVVALTYLHGGTVYLEDAAPGLRVRITMPLAKARTLPNGNVSVTSRTGTAS